MPSPNYVDKTSVALHANWPLQKCVWRHHDHFPFPNPIPATPACALAIAIGSDKQSKCCHTHQVLVITMKNKGNNNKQFDELAQFKNFDAANKFMNVLLLLSGDAKD